MKTLLLTACIMFCSVMSETLADNIVVVQPAPVVYVQTMVYQAPSLIVTVPVPIVVYPQPIIDQRIYWGYPYYTTTPMPTIQHRHRCWTY